ncbi:erythrocyte membrane protein 1, PfEMP1, putative [Plasmodium reichenowi]|uniref:Erythrocyte membrane protein 1, PfEMP1, putative n=1 Tax=Plasmodium reichenowi TaxID=5854 RepID=A0A2P9DTU6_PLARE|nr:erythrocyte membrane protein 1, PfEMP1, putative [Plasmodium reichenowi]
MAPRVGSGNPKDASAKHLFDRIGKIVHEEVKKDAYSYRSQLKGELKKAKFYDGRVEQHPNEDPCKLRYTHDTNVTVGQNNENPCHGRQSVRFSDEKGAECYRTRINGNEKYSGACAPLRRLHLCDKNLEQIRPEQITNTHNLLVDVLLAAQHEGKSLVVKHKEYKKENDAFDTNICTVLARSFADIGDIIRGKDMYLGHKQGKQHLEKNLKNIFKNIYEGLKDPIATERYKQDNETGNYYQLREDWWALNREQVWKAITCDAEEKDTYFKNSSGGEYSFSGGKCRHRDGNVPTNLDYVPQYLRWFHEWTEDFCRKRKVKLENAIKKCREGDDGEDKYCTLNGYDCTKSIRGDDYLVPDSDCTKCSVACDPYVKWIDIEKREFEKQKKKYANEINGSNEKTKKDTKQGPINNLYVKKFYDELQDKYKTVEKFLQLLSKENICKSEPKVGQNKANAVDFNEDPDNTFSHTEYCDPCPWCGVHKEGSKWIANNVNSCGKKEKTIYDPNDTTTITILSTGIGKQSILQKLKDFCSDNTEIKNDIWKCNYYNSEKNDCILQDRKVNTNNKTIMSYDAFFWIWVSRMLHDSIDWRTQLNNCINNGKLTKCIRDCKKSCKCFEKWVEKKKEEWKSIEQHFDKQKDMKDHERHIILELILKLFFMDKIEEAYGKEESKELKEKLNKINDHKVIKDTEHSQDAIKILLQHEEEVAKKCLAANPNDDCPEVHPDSQPYHKDDDHHSDHEDEHNDELDEEEDNNVEAEEDNSNHAESAVCKIVEEHFKLKNILKGKKVIDGCNEKCDKTWSCNSNEIESGNDGTCIPPRRQALCISNLKFNGQTEDENKLREAFINCVAKETYFLWEKYKKKNTGAEEKLKKGEIPDDFKRMMYYTYGDYRDLLFGTDIMKKNDNTNKVIKNINEFFECTKDNEGEVTKKREDCWNKHKKVIWDALLCGLTHDLNEDEKKKIEENTEYQYTNLNSSLEEFAQRPQFLRWYIEWSDEFCTERKKLEDKVAKDCSKAKDFEGCDKPNTKVKGNCANACSKYKEYITKKKTQYESQKKTFEAEKNGDKSEYKAYSNKEASEYLKDKCLFRSCECMGKVKTITDYWTNPHTTYENPDLSKKCQCPTPPCEIVDKILGTKDGRGYRDGCKWKYDTTRRGLVEWNCGKTSGEKDGDVVCVPPRRQRLYLHDLQEFTGNSQEELRKTFIECAAVETFFAWHEYKKEKQKEEKERKERQDGLYTLSSDHSDAEQKELDGGTIPEEFKRQMFYTLADYRDILYRGDTVNGGNTGTGASSNTETLKEKIDKVFEKSGDKKTPSDKEQRENWWNEYGQHIWYGMLCALSYDTKTKEKNKDVRDKLISPQNKNNYNDVSFQGGFDNTDTSSAKKTKDSATTETKLEDFVKRPQYFRWLEEWGDVFCTKRTFKLKMIKEDCGADNSSKNCGDDGFDCDKMCPNKNEVFSDFTCQSCAISCRKYKKWIKRKKDEFTKQQQKYTNAIKDPKNKSGDTYDNKFIKTLEENYSSADSFLNNLKGPCKNNNGGSNINFKEGETFEHAENCKPCPVIDVNIKNGHCEYASNGNTCNGGKITEQDIEKMNDLNGNIDMLVSDNGKNKIPEDLNVCENSGIFDGIKENKWECGKFCGLDVCKPIPSDKENVETQYILIRTLFKHWVENFLQDYNKINAKISHCTKNGENKCIKGCKNKCNCVEKWINKKITEWEKIRDRYLEPYISEGSDTYFNVISFLETLKPQTHVLKAIEPFTDLRDFQDTCGGTDPVNSKKEDGNKKDVVECLLIRLKNRIDSCKTQHRHTHDKPCPATLPTNDEPPPSDTLQPHMLSSPPFCNIPGNPCAPIGATNVVSVMEVAEILHQEAKDKMLERSGKKDGDSKGKSVLEADASKGEYKCGGNGNELIGDKICDINTRHSNAKNGSSNNPCHGKGPDRLKIGQTWSKKGTRDTTYDDFYLPQRREHMCTSNLEYLLKARGGQFGQVESGKCTHSFLGDVLLAAKKEAEFIKSKVSNNDNGSAICRAMKNSFADIGDIIRGTDLWDINGDATGVQNNLKDIFSKITEELKKQHPDKFNDNDKYATDDPKHTKLRADWWEANRDQVWKAMQCPPTTSQARSGGNIECGDTTPYDDYIPQRLRWMTEWAEWYCKMQKEEYKTLQEGCRKCRSEKCKNGHPNCTKCITACEAYTKRIKDWEKQWDEMKEKYEKLYKKAKDSDTTTSSDDPKDEKDVVAFLKKLHEKNKENKIYSTAAGYIHQEAKYLDCNTQTQFCDKKNGETSPSSKDNDKEYAFRDKPYDHEQACACVGRNPDVKVLEEPCDIVDEILINMYGKMITGCCEPKKYETYEWQCDKQSGLVTEDGICMPPRRQKLCLYHLTELSDAAKGEDLRDAFIKCAAEETFLLWQYYKSKNDSDAKILDRGFIPPQFLRSMMYTFADYRDICFGTNISKKDDDVDIAKQKIDKILPKEKYKKADKKREELWNEYSPSIWRGMLCALSHASGNKKKVRIQLNSTYINNDIKEYLEEFAERPPFLRWYIEWSDKFCREQKKEYNKLVEGCRQYKCNGKNGDEVRKEQCEKSCKAYKTFIDDWKPQWTQQSEKYQNLYTRAKQYNTNNTSIDETEKKHLKYLNELKDPSGNSDIYSKAAGYLEKEGYISECMEQDNFSNVDDEKYAFKDYPHDHQTKCDCKKKEAPPLVPPTEVPKEKTRPKSQPSRQAESPHLQNAILSSTIMWSVGISFAFISYFLLKKKSKFPVDLFSIMEIPQNDYDIPTLKSKNRYIPYKSAQHKGKTYLYVERDTDEEKYMYMSDTSDITSSESEYEEMDINDIYTYQSPKYKTLIEVVLEPSKRDTFNTPSADTPSNKFTDDEWNELKHDFISQYLQNTEPNILHDNVDNNTHPNTLYFDKPEEKPFIMSIHDRDLYTGEEISYNVNMSINTMDDPKYVSNNVYSGIDLINDTLSGNKHIDIYDEVLKRKENELFGTNHTKNTSNNCVAKLTNSDPIMNQLDLLDKWLDRHRDMCEKLENNDERLAKLKQEWNKDNNKHNGENNINKTLNTDVSIEIDMDNPKTINQFSNMDTNVDTPTMDNMEDDIYYDVNDDDKPSVDDIPMDHNKVDVPKKVHVEMKILNNTSNGSLEQQFPISDVWNI